MSSHAAATDIPIATAITPPKLAEKNCEIKFLMIENTQIYLSNYLFTKHVNNGVILVPDITEHGVLFPEELYPCAGICNASVKLFQFLHTSYDYTTHSFTT